MQYGLVSMLLRKVDVSHPSATVCLVFSFAHTRPVEGNHFVYYVYIYRNTHKRKKLFFSMIDNPKRTEILVSFGCIFYGSELVEGDGRQSVRNSD